MRMRMVVDLPAPFGPRKPSTGRGTEKVDPGSRAPGYDLLSP